MRLRRTERDDAPINLTPLIDVVFLLLIFFMVSTTFQHRSELNIELPEASAERPEREADPVEVSIDAEGRFYLNGRPLADTRVAGVRAALQALAAVPPVPPLVISADAATPYQAVITVMDAAGQAGFVNLALPVQAPPQPAPAGTRPDRRSHRTSSDTQVKQG